MEKTLNARSLVVLSEKGSKSLPWRENPIVRVRHVDPKHMWYAKINPVEFWKAVRAKMKTLPLAGDDAERKSSMLRLATGPSFTREEIRTSGIATDMMDRAVDDNFNPEGFANCVIEEMKRHPDSRVRDYFFSRKVLEEAGILSVPKK